MRHYENMMGHGKYLMAIYMELLSFQTCITIKFYNEGFQRLFGFNYMLIIFKMHIDNALDFFITLITCIMQGWLYRIIHYTEW